MPNNLVFNGTASQLQSQVSGVDSNGTVRAILTDDSGRLDLGTVTVTAEDLDIRNLTGTTDSITIYNTVTVTAEDLDIRNLTGTTDSITIYNTVTVTAEDLDIRPLTAASDSIMLGARLFSESNTTIAGVTDSAAIMQQDTSEQNVYSFYVFNTGENTVTVNLQVSPTTTDSYFVDDTSGAVGVAAGEKAVLVAAKYLQYTRLFYSTGGATCTFDVYYNAAV
ncbi:MAG: hypothetical protein PWP27_513 [Clostridiales bacterium]|jgi:hypothetical protein|nr:hypothetical protein [Clostridiales bacterium]MDK2932703.1 hypothetical protein [Clostridiales bacterium]